MWVYVIIAILVGLMFPTQSAVNGVLREEVGNPFLSGAISNTIGAVIMLILAIASSDIYSFNIPVTNSNNWYMWLGGGFSAAIVVSNIVVPQKIGFVVYMSLFLVFQLVGSTLIDYAGLFQTVQRSISFQMVVGMLFLMIGIVIIVNSTK